MKVLKNGYFDKNDFLTPITLDASNTPFFSNEKITNYMSIFSDMFGESTVTPDERLAHDFSYAFSKGWQVNLETEFNSANHGFCLVVQSDKGGGSFADVKMATLKKRHAFATGIDDIDVIQAMARDYLENHEYLPASTARTTDFVADIQTCLDIIRMSDPKAKLLQRRHHEWLRDYLNYTNYLGGIQVPIIESPSHETTIGWLRIAVSGAPNGWQDLMMAIIIAELASDMLGFYIDFDDLSATVPEASFLIDIRKSR